MALQSRPPATGTFANVVGDRLIPRYDLLTRSPSRVVTADYARPHTGAATASADDPITAARPNGRGPVLALRGPPRWGQPHQGLLGVDDVWSYPNIHGDTMATATALGLVSSTSSYDPFGNPLGAEPDNAPGNFDYGWLGQHQRPLEHEAGIATIEMGHASMSRSSDASSKSTAALLVIAAR